MLKRVFILMVAIILFSTFANAEGQVRTNYEETIAETSINGHLVELVRYNVVYHQEFCVDIFGGFLVWRAWQGQRLKVDGIVRAETPPFAQRDNFEHCPKLGWPQEPWNWLWNREHWSSFDGEFRQVGNQLQVRVRNYGGACYSDISSDFPARCFETYDVTNILSTDYPTPNPAQCSPSDGPCCRWDRTFYDSSYVCASSIPRTESCGNGICAGTRTQFVQIKCSGNSASCNGIEEPVSGWSECIGGQTPHPEFCGNNLDDDCDGSVDEGITTCMNWANCQTFSTCSLQCPSNFDPLNPPDEICDNRDNNCNGQIDETWPNIGRTCFAGVGVCRREGIINCNSGGNLFCNAGPAPPHGAEVCGNELDDNCNGVSDEPPCPCNQGATRNCGVTDVGECTLGTATCASGEWACDAIMPQEEICDGLDNDCDGVDDNSFGRSCWEGNENACEAKGWEWNGNACCGNDAREGPPYGNEICDQKDNDCDGTADEGHVCPVRCSDGTLENQCSGARPYYCIYNGNDFYGEFQTRCDLCGCPNGRECGEDGWCYSQPHSPPWISDFYFEPGGVFIYQDVYFYVNVTSESPILNVRLDSAYFDHAPSNDEINSIQNWQITNVAFFDDGLHNDGMPNDGIYSGRKIDGFSISGYYVFRVSATNVYLNIYESQSDEILGVINQGQYSGCSILEENGNPAEKMNFYFIAHADNGADPFGFSDDEIAEYYAPLPVAVSSFKSIPVISGEFEDKFNFYRIDAPIDLRCSAPTNWGIISCNDALALTNTILNCNSFKQRDGANSDKIAIVVDEFGRANADLSGTSMHLSAEDWRGGRAFVHENGHLFGLIDIYFYVNTQWESVSVPCGANERRQCMMCNPFYFTFACPMNNRDTCRMRDDVPDNDFPLPEQGQFCNDNFASDEAYLRDLFGRIP